MLRCAIAGVVLVIGMAVTLSALLVVGGRSDSYAHSLTGTPHLELDMVQDADGTWCNPVDTSTTHVQGRTYEVAVCSHRMPPQCRAPSSSNWRTTTR